MRSTSVDAGLIPYKACSARNLGASRWCLCFLCSFASWYDQRHFSEVERVGFEEGTAGELPNMVWVCGTNSHQQVSKQPPSILLIRITARFYPIATPPPNLDDIFHGRPLNTFSHPNWDPNLAGGSREESNASWCISTKNGGFGATAWQQCCSAWALEHLPEVAKTGFCLQRHKNA